MKQSTRGMKRPELLLPAGNLTDLKLAVTYGADAVYMGGEAFSLRAKADNFTDEDLAQAVAFAHANHARVYVAANIFAHEDDLPGMKSYLQTLNRIRPDGVLISDPGVFSLAVDLLDGIEIHISTQANNTNSGTFQFWHRMGASRVVAARELSLRELKKIRREIPEDMEIEAFVHGAMCISYSGRCLLSNYFTGRDANQGACTHPCRWKYALMEESRPGEFLPIEEDERGSYIMNARDLCMVDHIPELLDAGVDSFKVEGRMKSALYIVACAQTYRRAIDDCLADENRYRERLPLYRREIASCTNRGFSTGFFFGKPGSDSQIYENSTYVSDYVYLGYIEGTEEGRPYLTQKNKFSVGETVEIMRPKGDNSKVRIEGLYDENGKPVSSAPHPKQRVYLEVGEELHPFDVVRICRQGGENESV